MKLEGINDNPLSARWKKRFSEQSIEIQNKLKQLDTIGVKDYQLKVIKKSKIEPKDGDIFVLSPREGIFFYGRVLKANIEHVTKDSFIHGKHVIVIFKCRTKSLDISNYYANYNDLLTGPDMVDNTYWTKGLFLTIGNIENEMFESELDYGFYSIGKCKYFKENGHELDHQPKVLGIYGIATIAAIARNIEKELIMNPDLLVF